ncbi:flagellar hook-associated protein FlgL [Kineococcus sp. SYSU DK003]|uniref:flagellar hook-associated protein FlgL n=1 Tax=Kineococcus sp. SYSU DK003 TaxID=3383124 RepID=UPI003D7CAB04
MTQRSIAMNSLTNLQNMQARSAQLREQITSGTSLSKGSDDSVRAAAALRLNDQVAVNTQNSRNLTEARAWMTTQEPALQSTTDALQRVRDLTVQAGNGALDDKGRAAIAAEIRELKNTILGDANTQYQGRAVFAGTSAAEQAYDPEGYATTDDTGVLAGKQIGIVTRTISPGVEMQVNISGKAVYGSGDDSVFKELDVLAENISLGKVADATAALATIDKRINLATTAMATIGAKTNQLDHAEEVNTNQLQYLTTQLEDVSGVDTAKAYMEITAQSVAYQAALQVTAKTIQSSLVDFLR